MPGQATTRPWLKSVRAVVITGLLAVALWSVVDLDKLTRLFARADLFWGSLAVLMLPAQAVLGGLRWQRVAKDLGLPLSRRYALEEYSLSMGLNQILPGGLAGDAVRVWRHKSGHGALGAPLRAAVVDRVIGHVAHLVVTLVGLMLWPWAHGRAAPLWAWLVVVGILAVVVVIALRPLAGLRSLVADAKMALSRPRQWGVHTLLSTALLASILFGFYAAARALGLPLGWGVLTAVPLMMLVLILPVSVGGWGIREVASILVFSLLEWSATDAVAVSAAYGMSCLVGALPAVVFWFKQREVE